MLHPGYLLPREISQLRGRQRIRLGRHGGLSPSVALQMGVVLRQHESRSLWRIRWWSLRDETRQLGVTRIRQHTT